MIFILFAVALPSVILLGLIIKLVHLLKTSIGLLDSECWIWGILNWQQLIQRGITYMEGVER